MESGRTPTINELSHSLSRAKIRALSDDIDSNSENTLISKSLSKTHDLLHALTLLDTTQEQWFGGWKSERLMEIQIQSRRQMSMSLDR